MSGDRLSAERDYRRLAHQAVTEGVNLKYVEQMRQALYAAADELDAVRDDYADSLASIDRLAASIKLLEADLERGRSLAESETRAEREQEILNRWKTALAEARKERDDAIHGRDLARADTRTEAAALASAREALEQEREKWSFDTLLFVAEQLLARVYPPDVFPRDKPLTEGEPRPRLVRALHLALEDCRRAGGGDPA